MKKEVSSAEIEFLHQFCIKHFVRHYDVRIELVDHLASSIEKIWETDATIPFEKALENVYSSYGKLGFRKLMKEKELAVEKSSNKGIMLALKSFFGWPQISILFLAIMTSNYFYSFYSIGNIMLPSYFIAAFCIITLLSESIISWFMIIKRKSLKQPLLSTNIYIGFFSVYVLDYIIVHYLVGFLFERNIGVYIQSNPKQFIVYAVVCILSLLINAAKLKYTIDTFKKAKMNYPMAFK